MTKTKVQLWVFECPYCHKEVASERPPCRHCGVFWGPGDCKVYQAGPPGAHLPKSTEEDAWGLVLSPRGIEQLLGVESKEEDESYE